jgi:zinc protease
MNAAAVFVLAALAAARAPVSAPPDRSAQPKPAADKPWRAPEIQRFTVLGVDGYLIERHEVPIVELTLGWDLGEVNDPPGKEGMHQLCADLVDEGTRTLDKSALEDKKADLGATLHVAGGREATRLSLRVARHHLPGALDLVSQLLLEPGLRAADLERLRARYKAGVLQERGAAESVAGRVLAPVLWGASHPYGGVITEESLDRITAEDCALVAGLMKPAGAKLVLVGDATAKEMKGLLEERLRGWSGRAPPRRRIEAPKPAPGTIFFVDVPGAAQSRIIVAHHGPPRGAPDHYATKLMAQVLGSGIPSRVVQNLREKNGFSYGASAGFAYGRSASSMIISSSVRTDVTAAALREVLFEMKDMTARPPSDEEVTRERLGTIGAQPNRFGTGSSTLGSIWELLFYDLPLDTWARLPREVKAVTTAHVHKAVKERLQTTDLVVVVAGDRGKIFAELKQLADEKLFGSAGIVELDGDGRPRAAR